VTIKYHAGRRIQGLKYTASTLTTSGFAGTWDKSPSDSQFEVSSGKLNFLENASSGGDRTWIDLGTDVSETKWLLRVRLRFTTIATQSDYPEIDLGISDNHANSDTDQDFIGCRILPMAANNLFRPRKCIAEKPRRGAIASHNPSPAFTTGKDYYIEFKRTSATNWSASLSDTDAYDGDIYSGSFTNASTSLNGLRYFTVMDGTTATSANMEGYIDVFEFYNDTNTVVASSGDAKPTNVQVGSRLEETDTRKMYSYNEPDFNKTDCVGYYTLDEASGNPTNHVTTANGFTDIPTETIYYLKHGHDSTGTHWVKKVGSTVTTITQAEWNALSGAITESHKGNQTGALPNAWSGMWQGSTSAINGHGWYAISFSTDTNSPANGSSGATQNVTGKFGKCFEFSGGNNEQVGLNGTMIADTTNDQTADFTISCWVNHDNDNGNYPMLVSNYTGSNTGGFQFYINGTANTVTFWTSTNNVTASGALSSGSWHHVVCVRESGTVKFYINENLNSSTISNTHYIEGLVDCAIGGKTDGGNGLNGKIDEVSIWRRALSESEISKLYNSGTGKTLLEAKQAKEWQEIGT
jgi:hypothetical protein